MVAVAAASEGRRLRRAWAAVPLVALAGCVDAIGWLRLHELFVSFMSGTSTMLGVALAGGELPRAAVLAVVVGLFLAGGIAGAAVGHLAGAERRAAAVLWLVAGLLTLAAWRLPPIGGGGPLPPWAWAMVPAMGALNTALPGVGGITFVTGSLARCAEALVAAVAGAGPRWAWVVQIAAWAALVAGATGGAALERAHGADALAVPACAAAGAALVATLAAARGAARRRRRASRRG
jgi:uncharacterized membrane protein YoaK (UPF0700 family)